MGVEYDGLGEYAESPPPQYHNMPLYYVDDSEAGRQVVYLVKGAWPTGGRVDIGTIVGT